MKRMMLATVASWLPGMVAAQVPVRSNVPDMACLRAETVPGFEGFGTPVAVSLAIGTPTRVRLAPARPPAIAGGRLFKPGTYRGEAVPGFVVERAGRYRIAVSARAWVAVERAGGEVAAVAHDHGPPCSGIVKTLTFDLLPGRYALILSEVAESAATVMVVRE